MYARVARWEGGDAESISSAVAGIREQSESGPPEGLPAKRLLILTDDSGGRVLALTFFETEDDYRQGDETLNSMTPPGDGMGQRTAVEKYEVALELQA
jgi:hypothetical protein